MTKVFISYSRKDKMFAEKLNSALKAIKLESWIDWDDIPPTADWWDQIEKGIQSADAFLFLISCDSATSKVCGQEIDHALKNGKRIIPLVVRDVNPNDVHHALAKLNWIFFREQDDFNLSLKKLENGIKTDLSWVESQRRLQVRAVEWEKRIDRSLLLRGKDLREAEEQLASAGQKDPQPTDLQRRYILESRRGESRTRNIILAIGAVIIVSLAFLSIFAFNQRNLANDNALTAVANRNAAQTSEANAFNEANARATAQAKAEEQARIALSRQLAAQANAVREKDLALSLILSKEALNAKQTSEAKSALMQGLQISPKEFVLQQSGEPIISLALNPDKHILAAGSTNGDIYLWDISNPALPTPLGKPIGSHTGPVNSLAFSPDGRTLASGSDKTILFWDITDPVTPRLLGEPLEGHSDDVVLVFYRPNSQIFISASLDSAVVFWDVSIPTQPTKLESFSLGYSTPLESIAVSQDARLLASAAKSDSLIRLWDISNPAAPRQFEQLLEGETMPVISLAFSPDAELLVSGSMDNTILLFDIADPENPRWVGEILNIDTEGVHSLAVDGKTLVAGSSGGVIYRWDITNPSAPKQIGATLPGHTKQVNNVIFDPTSNSLVSASLDGRVVLWGIYTPYAPIRSETSLTQPINGLQNIAFSLDGGKLAASGGFDEPVIIWDVSNPSFSLKLKPFPAEQAQNVLMAAFGKGPDSLLLIQDSFSVQDSPGPILTAWDIFEPSSPKQAGKPWQFSNPMQNIAINSTGDLLAATSEDTYSNKTIFLWDISRPTTPKLLGTPIAGYSGNISDIEFGGTKNALAVVVNSLDSNETVIFWDISNLSQPQQVSSLHQEQTGNIFKIAISPQGNLMASWGSQDNYIRLWDISDLGNPIQIGSPIEGNGQGKGMSVGPYSVAFNQAGTILASGGTDGTVLLWDISNPGEPRQLGEHLVESVEGIQEIAFNSNGLLASLDQGGSISLWATSLDFWETTACKVAHRNLTKTEAISYLNDTKYEQHPTCPEYQVTE